MARPFLPFLATSSSALLSLSECASSPFSAFSFLFSFSSFSCSRSRRISSSCSLFLFSSSSRRRSSSRLFHSLMRSTSLSLSLPRTGHARTPRVGGEASDPPQPQGTAPQPHLSLLELVGTRSGFGFLPRGLGGGFSAARQREEGEQEPWEVFWKRLDAVQHRSRHQSSRSTHPTRPPASRGSRQRPACGRWSLLGVTWRLLPGFLPR